MLFHSSLLVNEFLAMLAPSFFREILTMLLITKSTTFFLSLYLVRSIFCLVVFLKEEVFRYRLLWCTNYISVIAFSFQLLGEWKPGNVSSILFSTNSGIVTDYEIDHIFICRLTLHMSIFGFVFSWKKKSVSLGFCGEQTILAELLFYFSFLVNEILAMPVPVCFLQILAL